MSATDARFPTATTTRSAMRDSVVDGRRSASTSTGGGHPSGQGSLRRPREPADLRPGTRADRRLAVGLMRLGIEPLERVMVQLPNWSEFVFAYFALQKIGPYRDADRPVPPAGGPAVGRYHGCYAWIVPLGTARWTTYPSSATCCKNGRRSAGHHRPQRVGRGGLRLS